MHTLEDIRQMKNIKHYKPPLKSSIGIYKKKKKSSIGACLITLPHLVFTLSWH
jgi:hypothetical protein